MVRQILQFSTFSSGYSLVLLALNGATWLVLANEVREGMPFQAGEVTAKGRHNGFLCGWSALLCIPIICFFSVYLSEDLYPLSTLPKCVEIASLRTLPYYQHFFLLEGKGDKCLCPDLLSCTENVSVCTLESFHYISPIYSSPNRIFL